MNQKKRISLHFLWWISIRRRPRFSQGYSSHGQNFELESAALTSEEIQFTPNPLFPQHIFCSPHFCYYQPKLTDENQGFYICQIIE